MSEHSRRRDWWLRVLLAIACTAAIAALISVVASGSSSRAPANHSAPSAARSHPYFRSFVAFRSDPALVLAAEASCRDTQSAELASFLRAERVKHGAAIKVIGHMLLRGASAITRLSAPQADELALSAWRLALERQGRVSLLISALLKAGKSIKTIRAQLIDDRSSIGRVVLIERSLGVIGCYDQRRSQ